MDAEKAPDALVKVIEQDPDHSSQGPTTVPHLDRWPSDPQPLTNSPWSERALDAYDIALCLTPIVLMVEAVLCIIAAHRDRVWTGFWVDGVSNLTLQLIRFNGQLTTAFTIIFVLIFTTFLKRYALWRAQSGETVARLEQYQASTSLPSTLKAILSLRSFNSISYALLFAWSFYYVGSQASKEEYKFETNRSYKHGKFGLAYQSPVAPSMFEPSIFNSMQTYEIQSMYTAFQRWCLSDLDTSYVGYDLDGNMKIPWIEWDAGGWQDTRVRQEYIDATYAGIDFEGEPLWDGNNDDDDNSKLVGDYQLNTSVLVLNCGQPALADITKYPQHTLPSTTYTINMTSDNAPLLSFDVWDRYQSTAIKANCVIRTQPIEVKGHCGGTGCSASWVRTLPYVQELEVFDKKELVALFLEQLLASQIFWLQNNNNWPWLEGYVEDGGSLYSSVTTIDDFDQAEWAHWFTYRMQATFNTWYTASQAVNGPLYWNPPSISQEDMYKVITGKEQSSFYDRTTFKGAIYDPRYNLSIPWVVADLMSNTVLVAAAVMSFWLRKHTLAPDIFGYVSSLTRDNPNILLPSGGTALSGWDRARLLKDVRVRIADVGSDGVGRVTLLQADAPPVSMSALAKERSYV